MRQIVRTGQFKKDVKRAKKRGKSLDKLWRVIKRLAQGKPLPAARKDHPLRGRLKGCREYHIGSD